MTHVGSIVAGLGLAALLTTAAAAADRPVPFTVVDGGIPQSLTGAAGDSDVGKAIMINRKLGNCLACHQASSLQNQPFHGDVGPSLDGAGSRWSEAELRLIVANSKQVFPDTIMPAFHATKHLHRVAETFQGKAILTAQQVEDVVAYLKTLTDD